MSGIARPQTPSGSRQLAYELLRMVFQDGAYANLALPKLLATSRLPDRDRAFTQELAFGSIRNRGLYEAIVEHAAKRSISELDEEVIWVLLIGCHQLLELRVPNHAAISETVNLAKANLRKSVVGLVNGVLRRVSEKNRGLWQSIVTEGKTEIESLSTRYSHPEWITRALRDALELDGRGDDLEELLRIDNEPPKVSLARIGDRRFFRSLVVTGQLKSQLNAETRITGVVESQQASPIGATLNSGDPSGLAEVKSGDWRIQDQGSQLAALALIRATEVSPSERWLDLCSGPGGKAVLLAAAARECGAELLCNELSPHRAKLVEDALRHSGLSANVVVGDALELSVSATGKFDRILLDAPCTGLGALRRRPEARWRKAPKDLDDLCQLQEKLLRKAWDLLAPGGVLAYVTCSPLSAETIAPIAGLLKREAKNASIIDAWTPILELNSSLLANRSRKTVQLWPQVHNTDAMFIALISKSLG